MFRDGVLIIGYGSPLRGDDAAGPIAAERLAALGYAALVVHQLTPELAHPISGARIVFFLDADTMVAPGEVSMRPISVGAESAWAGEPLEHHVTPAGLLQLASVAYHAHPEALVVGLGGASFEEGDQISPAAERAIASAVEAVMQRARA